MNTVQDFENKLNSILTRKLPARVEVDELGNTIPAAQWRKERCGHLATQIKRIAWSGGAYQRAMAVAERARKASR